MDIFSELKKRMRSYSKIEDEKVVTVCTPCDNISDIKIRDNLMEIGNILEFDERNSIFVAVICSGFSNRNPTVVGLLKKSGVLYIAAYAREGFIHQKTAQKAIQKVLILLN